MFFFFFTICCKNYSGIDVFVCADRQQNREGSLKPPLMRSLSGRVKAAPGKIDRTPLPESRAKASDFNSLLFVLAVSHLANIPIGQPMLA